MPEDANPDSKPGDDIDTAGGLSEVAAEVKAPIIDPSAWDGTVNPNASRESVIAVIGAVSMMPDHRHWPAAVRLMLELHPEQKTLKQQIDGLIKQPWEK